MSRHQFGEIGDRRVTQRLFLALLLPDMPATDLATHLAPVQRNVTEPLRWRSRRQWHITMLFLGQRGMDQRVRICRTAAGAAQMTTAAPIRLQGCGRFNTALWMGVAAGDWLAELADRLSVSLAETSESPSFHGHVTVARSPHKSIPANFSTELMAYAGPQWVPDRLVLVRSVIGSSPYYQELMSWRLMGRR